MKRRRRPIKSLYYITHIDNIPSILRLGILAHGVVEDQQVPFSRIYDADIVSGRRWRRAPNGESLWRFANLYFQPRNPMLYRVIHERGVDHIAILGVSPQVLELPDVFISTGNAASSLSEIVPAREGLQAITGELWEVISSDWWREENGSKRKIMAECLVPGKVPPDYIHTVYVASHQIAGRVRETIREIAPRLSVVPEPHMFFLPRKRIPLTPTLSLVDGDMFFSQMQTLTISVNTVGVMGKGLASRAKYQFPDVYVFYQDLCRRKVLRMGKPYLYKREVPLDKELAADPFSLPDSHLNRWFLLFPTKRHWRERSDIGGIEEGLRWIQDNYQAEGVRSLALPALGCGLGGLDWRDVGPLICRYMARLEIPVAVYLPREGKVPREHLSREFLLGSESK
ncbi:MAG: DUF4433 domain-containing protein [Chloroflexi bacterium]|nr:MAG: DUF4433 domain-containing protein [Chloroflexota bacterium]